MVSEGRRNPWRRFRPKRKTPGQQTLIPLEEPPTENQARPYTSQEIHIYDIAEQAYLKALQTYHNPTLPNPVFLFDYSKEKGFFINNQTWEITLNLANTPNIHLDKEYLDYFYALSMHEIGHYDYCPYDGLTNMKLISSAIKGGVGKHFAPVVVNIFADILIDTRLYEKYPDLMVWEFKKESEETIKFLNGKEPSLTWKVLSRCYEIMWNKKMTQNVNFDEIEMGAQSICRIITQDRENEQTWPDKVEKIGKVLKPLLKQECRMQMQQMAGGGGGFGGAPPPPGMQMVDVSDLFDDESEIPEEIRPFLEQLCPAPGDSGTKCNPFTLPEDVVKNFGDLTEMKNIELVKSGGSNQEMSQGPGGSGGQNTLETMAEQIAGVNNYRDFADTMNLHGFTDSERIKAIWYRGLARNLLTIQLFTKKPGGSIPAYPETWRIGDSIEELDFLQTLLVSPVVIPNLTTRKWIRKEGPGHLVQKSLPDMMIVIDSSGSMGWDIMADHTVAGRYHMALVSAFAAVNYALSKGSYISVINFSTGVRKITWTNDRNKIESTLLKYQASGTNLPTKQILEFAHSAKKKFMVFLISDLELQNWGPAKEAIVELIQMGNKFIGFFIDGHPDILNIPDFQELQNMGAKFYCISDVEDLCGLVIKEVKMGYGDDASE
jgi:hypothetical protein